MAVYDEKKTSSDTSRKEVSEVSLFSPTCDQGSERWAPVADYGGLYEVSDLGNIRRTKSRRKLRPFLRSGTAHLAVDLWDSGRRQQHQVHHLVAAAWVPQTDLVLVHRSDDPTDNRAVNLEWVPFERPRGARGRFARMQEVLREVEAQAVGVTNARY